MRKARSPDLEFKGFDANGDPIFEAPPPRACEECCKDFLPKKKDARFCSQECRLQHHQTRGRLARALGHTGKRLNDLTKAELARLMDEASRCNVEASCLECGKTYKKTRTWQNFCGDRCRQQFNRLYGEREIERLQGVVASLERQLNELRQELSRIPKADVSSY